MRSRAASKVSKPSNTKPPPDRYTCSVVGAHKALTITGFFLFQASIKTIENDSKADGDISVMHRFKRSFLTASLTGPVTSTSGCGLGNISIGPAITRVSGDGFLSLYALNISTRRVVPFGASTRPRHKMKG